MSNAVVTMGDIEKMAIAVAKSGLFGVKRPEEAMALMLVAQAEGRHPALAARDYDIIQGRPAKKTEAMLRDFLESGGKVEWHQLDDTIADATFSHPSGGTVKIAWDMNRAKAAGLASRDMWRKYPRQMLRSRTVSEGIRTVCPMATSGMYVPEEIRDIGPEKDITPASAATPRGGARDRLNREQQEKVDGVAAACQEHLDNGSADDAAVELDNAALDADEMVYFWDQFDAKAGKAIAEAGKALRKARKAATLPAPASSEPDKADTITPAQHKRLEARIKELGADRDKLKAYVSEKFGIEHLNALTKEAYKAVDAMLDKKAAKSVAPAEASIGDKIAACQTVAELDALAETLSEEDVGIYFDAVAARKAELQEGGL